MEKRGIFVLTKKNNPPFSMNIAKVNIMIDFAESLLNKHINLARKKFLSKLVIAVCQARSVQFNKLSNASVFESKASSNLRSIQRFFAEFEIDWRFFGLLMLNFFPSDVKFDLAMDRTEWQFGEQNVNFLVITAAYRGTSFPLIVEALDKKGCSNEEERIDLMEKLLEILPIERIGFLIADREFIGDNWLKYLDKKGVKFLIRIKKNNLVELDGATKSAAEWLTEKGNQQHLKTKIFDMELNFAMRKSVKKGQEDNVFLITNDIELKNASHTYRTRWGIETFFQCLKKRGFNFEETHLKDLERLKKMFMVISIAFAICLKCGAFLNDMIKPIAFNNHNYKRNSFFRHGLDYCLELFKKENVIQLLNDLLLEIAPFFRIEKIVV